jgi:uncharacterized membrane protein YkvI
MNKLKIQNMFRIIFVIIGTLIGAGFASGQEIYSFFVLYGVKGIIGIIIACIIISLIIYKTLKIIKENDISTYLDFIDKILPKKIRNRNKFKFIILWIVNIFLLISFYIMVAGFAIYFNQELGMNKIIGALIINILLIITFSKSIDGVIKINVILIPFLIILFIFLGIKKIDNVEFLNIANKNINWFIKPILYASYNSIVLIPILTSLKKHISNEKLIARISGILILVLSSLIYLILCSNLKMINNIEIPTVYIASTMGIASKFIYGFVILIAIFTSAVSAGYGFLMNISKNQKTYFIFTLLICISSIFVSQIGFSNLINLMYPLFGVLGIIQIFFVLIS